MGLNFNKKASAQPPAFIRSSLIDALTPINRVYLQSLGFTIKKNNNGEIRHLRNIKFRRGN